MRLWFRAKSKNGSPETQGASSNKGAWIGVFGAIAAAIIGGIFLLVSGVSTKSSPTPTTTPTTSSIIGAVERGAIVVTSYSIQTTEAGQVVISMSGIATDLEKGAELYAVARPKDQTSGTWQVSSGVAPDSKGRFATTIDVSASVPYNFQVIDVPPYSCPPGEVCAGPPPEEQLQIFGPNVGIGTVKSELQTVSP